MNRLQLAQEFERICSQYRFIKPREKGRPKNRSTTGRPRVVDPYVVLKLEEAFSMGCSVKEAIESAGISKGAYYDWLKINPHFTDRIEQLQQNPIIRARKTVFARMKFDADLALKFLERKLPEEFSLKAVVKHDVVFTGIMIDRPKAVAIEAEIEATMPEIETL